MQKKVKPNPIYCPSCGGGLDSIKGQDCGFKCKNCSLTFTIRYLGKKK